MVESGRHPLREQGLLLIGSVREQLDADAHCADIQEGADPA
jgi:hypothetical protein